MDTLGYLLLGAFVVASLFRSIALRDSTKHFDAHSSVIFFGVWTLISAACILPFYPDLILLKASQLPFWHDPIVLVVSVFKGVWLYLIYHFIYRVIKRSISSYTYSGPLATGFVAIFNSFLLGELLTHIQWGAILVLFLSGIVYLIIGHARVFNRREYTALLIIILAAVVFNGIDHYTISRTSWFVPFAMTGLGIFIAAIAHASYQRHLSVLTPLKQAFSKRGAFYGAAFAITDIFILMPMVAVLPVSIINVVGQGVIPLKMLLFAYLYREDVPAKQFAFGAIAFICTMVVIFVV